MTTTTNTAKKMYKVFAANHNGDVKTTSTKLNIITGENRIDVDMTVDRKTLKGAYNVFIKAVEQAVADGALDAKTAQFAYFADDINDINFDGKDSVTFADNNYDFAYGIDDNSDCDLGFYFWFFVKNDTNEPNPSEYAVTEDALEVAVRAEIQAANNVKINDLKWEIRYTEGSINDLDQNHIANAPSDQSLKERRTELVNELAALNSQLADLLPNEILQTGKMVSPEPNTDPEVDPIITGIKEEQAMTNREKLLALRKDYIITDRNHNLIADHTTGLKEENTMNNRDKFLKVAKVIKCEENINNAKCWYYNTLADIDTEHWKRISKARANEILFCYGLTAESFLAEQKLIDEETRKLYSEKFALKKIVHPRTIKDQADFYADKVKRDAQPSNDNVFDLLPDLDNLNDFSETDPYLMDDDAEIQAGLKEENFMTDKLIISAKWNKNDKITAYYINGEKVLKCDVEYACNHSGIIQVDYHLAQHFRALKYPGEQRKVVYTDYYGQTLMSKAAADTLGYKIVKNNSLEIFYVEPIQTDNPDDGSNDEEPDLIVETKRTKRDSINLKLNGSRISLRNLEERLSNAANENFSVINQYGKEYSCYPANNYGYFGESPEGYTIHFNTLGELIEHYAVDNIIHTAEPTDNPTNDTQDTDQLIDPPELPTAKPRTLRDSINRAIKQCIRNRISYLKSHNSKMEKYEYELLCLLQGARRELEIA